MTRSGKIQHFADSNKIEILLLDFVVFSIYNVWLHKFAKYEHLELYCQWATALCNAAINIANIEGNKIVCVHTCTHNKNLFKMLDFEDPVTNIPKTTSWIIAEWIQECNVGNGRSCSSLSVHILSKNETWAVQLRSRMTA